MRVIILSFLCLTVAVSLFPFSGFQSIEDKIVEYKLDNGLTLLILPRHEAPVASFVTFAKVGSSDEYEGITGMAHILEHMAFKGTKEIGTKDFELEQKAIAAEDSIFELILKERAKGDKLDSINLKMLETAFRAAQKSSKEFSISGQFSEIMKIEGGRINAGTSNDYTAYYCRLPSNKLELWMCMESERFLSPVLREFYIETQGPIAEERRIGYEDSPQGKLWEQFFLTAFPQGHPYRHPVIGFMGDILTATREKAREFFNKYYIPSNLIVAIVGDVEPNEVIRLAKIYWGRLPKKEPPLPLEIPEITQKEEKRIELKLQAQPILYIGYHCPSGKAPYNIIYETIADYLGRGRTSLLYKSLVKNKRIATNVGCNAFVPSPKYPSLFLSWATPAANHTAKECETAIYEQIELLKRELIPKKKLEKIISRKKAELVRYLDSNLHTALELAWYEGIYGDWHELFTILDKLEKITPEDIQKVAEKAFVKTNCVVGSIVTSE
ncbi:MAG: pitrilysin family protein [bacterium]|nr:pitrilysin family protein [bacterium]